MIWPVLTRSRPLTALLQTAALLAQASLVLILTAQTPVFAGAIYKSIDKDGNVIFTDRPSEGAENLKGESSATPRTEPATEDRPEKPGNDSSVDAFEPPNETVALTPEPENPPKSSYKEVKEPSEFLPVTVVEILTPINDAILQDPIGKIWVELQSYPTPLKKTGLTAELWMNDQLITKGKRPMLSLPAPERGTHVLQVKLVDEKGRLFLKSEPTHIHVKYQVKTQ